MGLNTIRVTIDKDAMNEAAALVGESVPEEFGIQLTAIEGVEGDDKLDQVAMVQQIRDNGEDYSGIIVVPANKFTNNPELDSFRVEIFIKKDDGDWYAEPVASWLAGSIEMEVLA